MRYCKILIGLSCLFFLSCAKRPVDSSRSASINAGGENNVRVMTYNIHHANPPSRANVIDITAIANAITQQQPDLVALQEVDVFTERSGKTVHEAEELGRLTGMKAYFAKAINYGGGEYGVAILSRLPIEAMKNTPLPTAATTNGEPRTLATAVITLPQGKKIVFACTHLDAQRSDTNRVLQINKIVEVLKQERYPVILAGDLNATPASTVINKLDTYFTRTCVTDCGFTIPVINPTKTIDFIAYAPANNFKVMEHKVIDEKYASDHLPVLSVIRIQ